MNKMISVESILKYAGWAALFSSIVLISINFFFNKQIAFPIIISGFSSGIFCLYLGYLRENYEK